MLILLLLISLIDVLAVFPGASFEDFSSGSFLVELPMSVPKVLPSVFSPPFSLTSFLLPSTEAFPNDGVVALAPSLLIVEEEETA